MRKSIENLAGRKMTGGRKVAMRGRRKFEIDRYPNEAVVGPTQIVARRTRGNNIKAAFKTAEFANVVDKEAKKVTKSKILKVNKNPANRDYERRGVISKGAVIETESGTAVVVSRPGQDGVVNAVLVKAAAAKTS
ncbi:30S ribosomal protein S8e [Candidatus Nitrososphaera gargensis Ga9.2]|uniref:Small ribosomal subunit protein eS8 n=2 Tax=Candidatus Nitrososphaera gargensis TaxID=497727 RepID=K0IMZ0_NITGG